MKAALIFCSFLLTSALYAQQEVTIPVATTSGMVLVGTVSDAQADDHGLRFVFTGAAIFTVRNYTPDRQTIRWELEKVPIRASAWSLPPKTDSTPYTVSFANAVEIAARRSQDHQKTSIGVEERIALVFDNFGQITSIEGGRISLWPPK